MKRTDVTLRRTVRIFPNVNEERVRRIRKDSSKSLRKERYAGQDTKSVRGMPWHWEPTKDAISCEKPRGAANEL